MNKIEYKTNNNIVYSCKYHIVWCPKYRRKVLVGEVETRLKELVIEIANELRVEIIEMETDKIFYDEPIEVTRSKYGIFPGGAGVDHQILGNLVFLIADTQAIILPSEGPSLVRARDAPGASRESAPWSGRR